MASSDKYILAINPGSTGMRIACYNNETLVFQSKIDHDAEELRKYDSNVAQYPLREKALLDCLAKEGFDPNTLTAVVGRGGKLPPLKQGAYVVDANMVDFLTHRAIDDHASNLGAILANSIAKPRNIPAYIYDAVVSDQLEDVARLSGLPEITRKSSGHILNIRASTIKACQKRDWDMSAKNIIACHLGAGISVVMLQNGRMVDVITDEEGPYSPERSGGLPNRQLIDLCYSEKYDKKGATRRTRGGGGLYAYLGTNSALEVEEKIKNGDAYAKHIYMGMCYQVAKNIASFAAVVHGKVDLIVLTGALAYSSMVMDEIVSRVSFLSPVDILAGENELEALAFGTLRVLRGEEEAHIFTE